MRVRRRRSKRGEWFNLLIFLSSFACWQASVMALKVMESATQASHTHVRSCSHMHAHTLSRWKHAYFAYEWHHRKLFSRVGFFFFFGRLWRKDGGGRDEEKSLHEKENISQITSRFSRPPRPNYLTFHNSVLSLNPSLCRLRIKKLPLWVSGLTYQAEVITISFPRLSLSHGLNISSRK